MLKCSTNVLITHGISLSIYQTATDAFIDNITVEFSYIPAGGRGIDFDGRV